jgi:glucose/arabinose dehydrogenase
MKTLKSYSITIMLVFVTSAFCIRNQSAQSNQPSSNQSDNAGLTLPGGFSATVFADKLGFGRHIIANGNGDVYLALQKLKNGKGIAALRDTDGDGKADKIEYFANTITTGIDISAGYLYFSNFTKVFRVPLAQGELVPAGNPVVIATGFEEQNQHQDKTFALDNSGNLYVNVGAPSNACQQVDRTPGSPGIDPCPQLERHAGIWRFKADVPDQDQVVNGHHYASGIRNSVAIAWNSSNNKLYVVQHGRDQLAQFYPDLYTIQQGAELPAEEFFLVEDGDNFGWPYCYYDQFKKQKILAPEYGGDAKAVGRCDKAKTPIMAFPGHLAPNDLLFYTGNMFPERYKNGAFIAFHGSWNRAPLDQKGFFVAFVPFQNGLPSGEMETFADGFAGVKVVNSDNEAQYRPMGLAQGPDGCIYVSDSEEGRVWRITYAAGK